jgi:hypothetical protein
LRLKEEGKTWAEIGQAIGRGKKVVQRRYGELKKRDSKVAVDGSAPVAAQKEESADKKEETQSKAGKKKDENVRGRNQQDIFLYLDEDENFSWEEVGAPEFLNWSLSKQCRLITAVP